MGKLLKYMWVTLIASLTLFNSVRDTSWIEAYLYFSWPIMFWDVLAIAGVIGITIGLYKLNPWFFGFGIVRVVNWISGKEKRFHADGTPEFEGSNINLMGTDIKFVGILMCLIILTALPTWARIEEEWFRLGTVGWLDGLIRSLIFGFVHMLVGVPICAAIGLTAVGLFYTQMYFMGGIELSTQAHFQYNLVLILLLLVMAIFQAMPARWFEEDKVTHRSNFPREQP